MTAVSIARNACSSAFALMGCSSALDGSGLQRPTGVAKQHLDIPKTASIPWPVTVDKATGKPVLMHGSINCDTPYLEGVNSIYVIY